MFAPPGETDLGGSAEGVERRVCSGLAPEWVINAPS